MTVNTELMTQVTMLQRETKLYGVGLTVKEATKLYRHVKDRGLCVDALLLTPRPAWVEGLLDPKKKKS